MQHLPRQVLSFSLQIPASEPQGRLRTSIPDGFCPLELSLHQTSSDPKEAKASKAWESSEGFDFRKNEMLIVPCSRVPQSSLLGKSAGISYITQKETRTCSEFLGTCNKFHQKSLLWWACFKLKDCHGARIQAGPQLHAGFLDR